MTREAVLSRVGEVAVIWNEAEDILQKLLWLYIETDVRTAEILTKPLRAVDREKLLRKLVVAKEVDQEVKDEICEAILICSACRDNRNTVLHNASEADGEWPAP